MSKTLFKSGLLLSFGNILNAATNFVRNIVVARLISVEDFGIASTIAATIALVELTSNLGFNVFIIQSKDGNKFRLQASIHTIQLAQGCLASVALFFLADPITRIFDIPHTTWAFQLLSVLPFVRSLAHMDYARFQRKMKFSTITIMEVGTQLIATGIAIPACIFLKDYRAIVIVVFSQIFVYVAISHFAAVRPYRLWWRKAYISRALIFGWPLLLNGLLIFSMLYGERAIVGAVFDIKTLGWFSAATTLALVPVLLISRVSQAFFVPLISATQDKPIALQRQTRFALDTAVFAGTFVTIGYATAGSAVIEILYGERYAEAGAFIGLMAYIQGLRIYKSGFINVAIALGCTKIPLFSNLARAAFLFVAYFLVINGYSIEALLLTGIVGELISTTLASSLIARTNRFKMKSHFYSLVISVIIGGGVIFAFHNLIQSTNLWLVAGTGSLTACAAGSILALLNSEIRRSVFRRLVTPEKR